MADLDVNSDTVSSRLRSEVAEGLHEIARLKARLYSMECENSDLKLLLKSSAIEDQPISAKDRMPKDDELDTTNIPEASLIYGQKIQKRSRSHSSDIVEITGPSSKKVRNNEEIDVVSTSSVTGSMTSKKRLIPYVEIPLRQKSLKATPRTPKKQLKMSPSQSSKLMKVSPSESKIKAVLKNDETSQMEDSVGVQEPRETEEAIKEPVAADLTVQSALVARDVDISQGPNSNDLKQKKASTNLAFVTDIYLQSTGKFAITPSPVTLEVPRKFLRLVYGGSDQQFFQYVQEYLNPSGPELRRLVFPQLDSNPFMPTSPGEAGLLFSSRYELLENSPWTLFCKRNASKAFWLYLGEYECAICGKLTAAQYVAQEGNVKREWAQRLLKAKAHSSYVSMRARIALRKHLVLPAFNKSEEEKLIQAEVSAIRGNTGKPLKEGDIISAFSNGEEGVDIIRMICVSYDHVFANDVVAKFPDYPAVAADSTKKKTAERQGKAGGSKKSPRKAGVRKSKTKNTRESSDSGVEYADEPGPGPSTSASRRSARQPVINRRYEDE